MKKNEKKMIILLLLFSCNVFANDSIKNKKISNVASHRLVDVSKSKNKSGNNELWVDVFNDPATLSALSTTWYNPSQSGHGFQFTLGGGVAVVTWYVYRNGQPFWLIGSTDFDGGLDLTFTMTETSGTNFPPNFNASDVIRETWGTLHVQFTGCNSATVEWSSVNGNQAGSMEIEKIFNPNSCRIHNEPRYEGLSQSSCILNRTGGNPDNIIELDTGESVTITSNFWSKDDLDIFQFQSSFAPNFLNGQPPKYYKYSFPSNDGIYFKTIPDTEGSGFDGIGCSDIAMLGDGPSLTGSGGFTSIDIPYLISSFRVNDSDRTSRINVIGLRPPYVTIPVA